MTSQTTNLEKVESEVIEERKSPWRIESGQVCAICGEQAHNKCNRCNQAFYCNAAHKVLDWPKHGLQCAGRKEFKRKRSQINAVRQSAITNNLSSNAPIKEPQETPTIGNNEVLNN